MSKHPDDNTAAAELLKFECASPFILPSLLCMRDPHDVLL